MPIPVAVAAGIVKAGVAVTKAVIGAIQAAKERKAEAWNNLMATPGMQDRYMAGWESVVNEAIDRYNLQEQYFQTQDEIDALNQFINDQLIPYEQPNTNGSGITYIADEGRLLELQTAIDNAQAELDRVLRQWNSLSWIEQGNNTTYNNFVANRDRLKNELSALRAEMEEINSRLQQSDNTKPSPTSGDEMIIARSIDGEEKYFKVRDPKRGNEELIYTVLAGGFLGVSIAYLSKRL